MILDLVYGEDPGHQNSDKDEDGPNLGIVEVKLVGGYILTTGACGGFNRLFTQLLLPKRRRTYP